VTYTHEVKGYEVIQYLKALDYNQRRNAQALQYIGIVVLMAIGCCLLGYVIMVYN